LSGAKAVCEAEGSFLAYIPSLEVHNNLTSLLQNKRKKFKHYAFVDHYWLGAKPITETTDWEWINNPMTMEESYSNWKTNVKSE
jgi:hypothetical protein